MSFYVPARSEVFEAIEASAVPLVFDSPHSGSWNPPDFNFACDPHRLRRSEDSFVDELWAGARAKGCGFLRAFFPRSYIDPNRALDDIDQTLFDAPWPGPVAPGEKAKAGMGLIRRLSLPGEPMYDRKLSVAEGQHRIAHYYEPYHAALDHLIVDALGKWGVVWYINCHSMKEYGNAMNVDAGRRRADFVLGDREGKTCGPELLEIVRSFLRDKGYSVALNNPYKGLELVRRHGKPSAGRHSLQIEINRALFLDEERVVKTDGFDRLKADLDGLVAVLAGAAQDAQLSCPNAPA
ncbi:MAG: N-formylglutamate amidohydrolase [Pseudomonadota bacterium]